jgi:acyl carrier protein
MDNALREQIKNLMVENLMLQVTRRKLATINRCLVPTAWPDSVDALQLVVALDKNFGLKVPDPAAAKQILQASTRSRPRLRSTGLVSPSLFSSDFFSSDLLSFFSGVLTSTGCFAARISRE